MMVNIILGLVIYFLCGMFTCLFIQMHDAKQNDSMKVWLFSGFDDDYYIIMAIVFWWILLFFCIIFFLIPGFIKLLYKFFILIVFSVVALFKKEKENE